MLTSINISKKLAREFAIDVYDTLMDLLNVTEEAKTENTIAALLQEDCKERKEDEK